MYTFGTLILTTIFACGRVPEPAAMRLAVDLVDGSRIIGVPDNKSLRLRTNFAEMVVPLTQVDLVTFKPDRETISIRFHNGDSLSGRIIGEPIKLKALFGPATIQIEHVAALETLPADVQFSPPLQDNLIMYFPFDVEPDGSAVINVAQDKLHGELTGAKWTRDGLRGGAFHFSQGEDRIEIPDDPALHLEQLTVCAWVFPDDSQHQTWRGILTKTSPGNWTGGFGLARYSGSPDVHFFVNYYSSQTVSTPIVDNQWSHVAASYDGKKMVLYLNGKRVGETTPTHYGGPIRHGSESLLIGAAPTGYHWIGKIDEVMLFGRVLNEREIERVYLRTQ